MTSFQHRIFSLFDVIHKAKIAKKAKNSDYLHAALESLNLAYYEELELVTQVLVRVFQKADFWQRDRAVYQFMSRIKYSLHVLMKFFFLIEEKIQIVKAPRSKMERRLSELSLQPSDH